MKTTVEIPDDLFREAKAAAARQGSSLKEMLTVALREHLAHSRQADPGTEPWRRVLGRADRSSVEAVDAAVEGELERVDPESWK